MRPADHRLILDYRGDNALPLPSRAPGRVPTFVTRYLQSHCVWLRFSYSSIPILLFVRLAAHSLEFLE